MFQPQGPHLPPAGKGWGRRGPVLLPLLGGRAGGPGDDSAGLSAAGAGAHRTGPVGASARGCALAPGGEAAEGGTGGIRSLHGNSCTDSGGWAGARGGGRRGGSRQGGGEGRGEGRARAPAPGACPGARTRLSPAPSSPSLGSSLWPAGAQRLPGAPQPPTRRLLHARSEPWARPRFSQLKLCPGPAPTSSPGAGTGQG